MQKLEENNCNTENKGLVFLINSRKMGKIYCQAIHRKENINGQDRHEKYSAPLVISTLKPQMIYLFFYSLLRLAFVKSVDKFDKREWKRSTPVCHGLKFNLVESLCWPLCRTG